jgi:hypothetical protein
VDEVSASLAFQKKARALLIANEAVAGLVPADNVLDANARPEVYPKIILGEDQELPADDVVGRYTRLSATFHVWAEEEGLAVAKAIAGAIRSALRDQRWTFDGYRCTDCRFESARFLRDPDGKHSHGVVTFSALIEEL